MIWRSFKVVVVAQSAKKRGGDVVRREKTSYLFFSPTTQICFCFLPSRETPDPLCQTMTSFRNHTKAGAG